MQQWVWGNANRWNWLINWTANICACWKARFQLENRSKLVLSPALFSAHGKAIWATLIKARLPRINLKFENCSTMPSKVPKNAVKGPLSSHIKDSTTKKNLVHYAKISTKNRDYARLGDNWGRLSHPKGMLERRNLKVNITHTVGAGMMTSRSRHVNYVVIWAHYLLWCERTNEGHVEWGEMGTNVPFLRPSHLSLFTVPGPGGVNNRSQALQIMLERDLPQAICLIMLGARVLGLAAWLWITPRRHGLLLPGCSCRNF